MDNHIEVHFLVFEIYFSESQMYIQRPFLQTRFAHSIAHVFDDKIRRVVQLDSQCENILHLQSDIHLDSS